MKKRIVYFDVLNILACFSVVCLHCNVAVHDLYSNLTVWYQALVVETICYWAVPVFLMLTGATLLNYRSRYDTKTFFRKRVLRTVFPWLFWSIVIFTIKFCFGYYPGIELTIQNLCSMFMSNQFESKFWFFPMLFAMYLSIPVLSRLLELQDAKVTLWYMFIVGFVTCSVCPIVFKLLGVTWNTSLQFPMVGGGYLLFVILGYLLSVEDIKPKYRYMVYIAGVLSVVFRYVGTVILSEKAGVLNTTLFSYTQFHAVLLAATVFLFVKHLPLERLNAEILAYLSRISSCSLGIYLIHGLVINGMTVIFSIPIEAWWWRLIAPFFIYGGCLFAVIVLKKIPIVRYIVP